MPGISTPTERGFGLPQALVITNKALDALVISVDCSVLDPSLVIVAPCIDKFRRYHFNHSYIKRYSKHLQWEKSTALKSPAPSVGCAFCAFCSQGNERNETPTPPSDSWATGLLLHGLQKSVPFLAPRSAVISDIVGQTNRGLNLVLTLQVWSLFEQTDDEPWARTNAVQLPPSRKTWLREDTILTKTYTILSILLQIRRCRQMMRPTSESSHHAPKPGREMPNSPITCHMDLHHCYEPMATCSPNSTSLVNPETGPEIAQWKSNITTPGAPNLRLRLPSRVCIATWDLVERRANSWK